MFQSIQPANKATKNTDSNSPRQQNNGFDMSEMMQGHDLVGALNSQPAQMMVEEEEEKPKQKKAIQKSVPGEKAVAQGKTVQKHEEDELQMKEAPESTSTSSAQLGSKTSLPKDVNSKMENSFGTSFEDVQIHQNDNSATSLGALAYTQGNNVHFAPGQYNPNTSVEQELLGHELTHVVQQRAGRVNGTQNKGGMNVNADKSLENEADEKGEKAAANKTNDIPPKHGVTNSIVNLVYTKIDEKLTNKKGRKSISVPADKELSVIAKGIDGNSIVRVKIDGISYEGAISNNNINLTPNNIESIPLNTRNAIVREKSSGMGNGNAKKDCYINYGNDVPIDIYSEIEDELNKLVSASQSLSTVNKTVSLPKEFSDLGYIPNLSDESREKYANKTFVFRYTRFNNGNTKDVILVEELGEINKNTKLDKDKADAILNQYNISIVQPGADAAQANTELKAKLGKTNSEEIQALHARAFLPFTKPELEAIKASILKLPIQALIDISGLKFGKKYCMLDKKDQSKADSSQPNAYYSSEEHAVILVKAGYQTVRNVFGDEDSSDFINRLEYTVIHEIGHAVDYKPYNAEYKPDKSLIDSNQKEFKDAKDLFNPINTAYGDLLKKYKKNKALYLNQVKSKQKVFIKARDKKNKAKKTYIDYMDKLNGKKYKTNSGAGHQLHFTQTDAKLSTTNSDIEEASDFTIALAQDAPNITEYSNNAVTEAYAEAFAVYVSEPKSLKILSPNVYEYFNNKYPHEEGN